MRLLEVWFWLPLAPATSSTAGSAYWITKVRAPQRLNSYTVAAQRAVIPESPLGPKLNILVAPATLQQPAQQAMHHEGLSGRSACQQ